MTFLSKLSLRAQLALAMAGCVLLAIIFGYVGLTLFGEFQTKRAIEALPSAAQTALTKLEQQRAPTQEEIKALLQADSDLGSSLEDEQNLVLLGLTIVACIVGAIGAITLANRIAEPMEVVAGAIRKIAQGDLSARAIPKATGSHEASKLVVDFNTMATALERYDRELVEGAAAIAHELRTPLTILRGRLQGMLDGVFEASPSEVSGLIKQVESLSRLVDDLQTISMAEVGELALQKAPVHLDQLLADLSQFLNPDIEAAGMRLELTLQPVLVQADPIRLRQAGLSLISNACRYAKSGGIVEIDCGMVGSWAVIRVMDRGPGLSDLAVENIFRMFWREDPSRARELGGSGIGLAVVDAIARAHGGTISASQRSGGGAAFELRLPLVCPG